MARRKRQLLEDDDSDSSAGEDNDFDDLGYDANDPDARAERELFENPYGHKRRRKNEKEDAIYGVFADEDDEEEEYRTRRGGRTTKRKEAPTFTAGEKVDLDKAIDVDAAMNNAEDSSNGDNEKNDEDEEIADAADDVEDDPMSGSSEEQSPALQEEEEERPRFGGLGLGASRGSIGQGASKGGIGSSKGGIGSSKGGIGSGKSSATSAFSGFSKGGNTFNLSSVTETSTPASPSPAPESQPKVERGTPDAFDMPTSFGRQSRPQRSFVRDGSTGSGTSTPKPANLSAQERVHFSKISSTFGARMLEKMGWQAGTGLGTTGEGIVTPVESKLRPKGMGLAFKGFKEKTEQAKAEARRRGEVVSDDDEEARPRKGRKSKTEQQERSDAWKKPKRVKKKIEHKTYEQIVAEAGQETPATGIGQIIDATGATVSTQAFHVVEKTY